ncbi:MAG TPA: hypothetical protein VFZ38_10695 [Vicinamibacterales bacterium]
MTGDNLDMDYINSLPQPFLVQFYGDSWWWPVNDFEVQTGLMRIDVCGLLQVKHFCEVKTIKDGEHREHDPDDFWTDGARALAIDAARAGEVGK